MNEKRNQVVKSAILLISVRRKGTLRMPLIGSGATGYYG